MATSNPGHPNNPVTTELQYAAKELYRLLSHADLRRYPEASKLEGAISEFICINECDDLDDIPDDLVVEIIDESAIATADVEWLTWDA